MAYTEKKIGISKISLVPYHNYFYFVFALRPGRPRHRNAAASGANLSPGLTLEAGAPAKAAYAMTGIFI
jgi:hypothetical protein